MTFTQQFLEEAGQIVKKIDTQAVDRLVALLVAMRGAGRLRAMIRGYFIPN
jgi:hypothetical protein